MDLSRRRFLVYALLAGVWALVVVWQVEEHRRVREYARTNLRNRSKDVANTLGAFIRTLEFRGRVVFSDRLQPVLNELVYGRTNELGIPSEVLFVAVLNTAGEALASAGTAPTNVDQRDFQQGERWGRRSLTVAYPVLGLLTNLPVLVDAPTNRMRGRFNPRGEPPSDFGPPPGPPEGDTNRPPPSTLAREGDPERPGPPPYGEGRPGENRRMRWLPPGLTEAEAKARVRERELNLLVLSSSADSYLVVLANDLRLRWVITFFAAVSVVGSGVAWRNLAKAADLQIRLVRASELNSHLKEMNLAAAGLAHETRNPLNIIRGLAHLISKQAEAGQETRQKSRDIINEADKVAAQLNEFINYSRPREVRRARLALASIINEVVRTLGYDLDEKRIAWQVKGDVLNIEADEQLLRQALFNLILNAIQAVPAGGEILVVSERRGASEAVLEVRDNGPGVPLEHRTEIFKPYFTTQKTGTGLGLAVVQQIVLAHGWDIECLSNEPRGAVFRISHLKVFS